jgi:putative ABC transport system permease protein
MGFRLAISGAVIGLFGAFAVSRLIQSALPGMASNNFIILPLATLGMVFVALLASYMPARRAAAIEPAVALRNE